MKLLDILVRDLKEWPKLAREAVGQAQDGSLHLGYANKAYFGHTTEKYQKADDWEEAHVTRAEWQAAVDALKQQESLAAGDVYGLPPIGAVCEFARFPKAKEGQWENVRILAHVIDDRLKGPVAVFLALLGSAQCDQAIAKCFRPIRTAEQIAEQKRKDSIAELIVDTDCILDETHAAAVIAAGYRKADAQ